MNLFTAKRCSLFVLLLTGWATPIWCQTSTPTPAVPAPITVDETKKPIRVDGFLVDWPTTRMILLDQRSQITYGNINWKTKDDFNSRVFITYDSQYLYLSAIIEKSSGVVNDNGGLSLWDGDCLELFLSAYSVAGRFDRISKGDYHIGFSPGTGCRNPKMYCFNKETEIGGGRISARSALHGYILEACIPLTFFEGLEIGPGKTTKFNLAVDEGGAASGNRMLQMDMTGNVNSWQNPSLWGSIEWIGQTEVSVPKSDDYNLYANLVMDGTKGATYWGKKTVTGTVVDGHGKALPGALITTWPRTTSATSDANGQFKLEGIKIYNDTVIYARSEGYGSSLAPVTRPFEPLKIRLNNLPSYLMTDDGSRPLFYGQAFQVPPDGDLLASMNKVQGWMKALPLNVLKLVGTDLLGKNINDQYQALDHFVSYARQLGAEPMIELPIDRDDPELAADWVRHCNVEKNEKIVYWTIGDEPDLYSEKKANTNFADYNVYDYINDFRAIYNSSKKVDPSILVMGPELAWKYTSAEDDWFTPFIQFDGDIVNLASVHHYASIKASQCNPKNVMDDVRHMKTLTRGLKDRIAVNSDVYVPLVITGGNVCLESTTNILVASSTQMLITTAKKNVKPMEDAGPDSFWAAIWEAEETGTLINDHMPMSYFSYLTGNTALSFFTATGAKPNYWVLQLLSTYVKGKPIWSQAQNSNVSVYATQDTKTKDVTLLMLNRGSTYYHPKIILNAQEENVSVDAGLNMSFDFELPYYSVAVLVLKADRSPGRAFLYTKKMALAGKPPESFPISPW